MSERVYRWLLSLYPRRFRDRFAGPMQQVFRDQLPRERRLRLWADVLRDLAVSVPREHLRPQPSVVEPGTYRMSRKAVWRMMSQPAHRRPLYHFTIGVVLCPWIGMWGDAPALPLLGFCVLVYGLVMYGVWRMSRTYARYQLRFADDRIQVTFETAAPREIGRTEIVKILTTPGFGATIQTGDARRSLFIPELVPGFREVIERLGAWAPIDAAPDRHERPSGLAALAHSPLLLFAFFLALLVRSPYYVAALAPVAALTPVWMLTRLRHAPLPLPSSVWLWQAGILAALAIKLVVTFTAL